MELPRRCREGDGVVHAFAQYTTKEKHPRFNLTFRDLGGAGSTRSVDMKLVATDYNDFALLWGCSEPNLFERKGDKHYGGLSSALNKFGVFVFRSFKK